MGLPTIKSNADRTVRLQKQIPLNSLEQAIQEDVLLAAEKLLDSHQVIITENWLSPRALECRFELDGTVFAIVKGTESQLSYLSCTCEHFEENTLCEHGIAAAILYRSGVGTRHKSAIGTAEKEHLFDRLSASEFLKYADPKLVVEFVRKQIRHTPQLKLALKTALIREIKFQAGINKYDLLLKDAMPFNIHGKLAMSKREISQFLKTCRTLLGYLEESLALKQLDESLDILEALLKRLQVLLVRSGFDSEETRLVLRDTYTLAQTFIKLEISPELRSRLFHTGMEILNRPSYRPLDFSSNIYQVMYPLHSDTSEAKSLILHAAEMYEATEKPIFKALEWHLAHETGQFPTSREYWSLQSVDVLADVTRILERHEKGRLILEVASYVPFDMARRNNNLTRFIESVLRVSIQEKNRISTLRCTALLLHSRSYKQVLVKCREALGEYWPEAARFLYSWCEHQVSEPGCTRIQAYLLKEMDDWDALLEMIATKGDLDTIKEYVPDIFRFDPPRATDATIHLLGKEIEAHIGPELNKRILEVLDVVERRVDRHTKSKIVDSLLKNYPERISLKQALRNLDLKMP